MKRNVTPHKIDDYEYYTTSDVCILFDCSKRTIQRKRASGKLPYFQMDNNAKTYFYRYDDVVKLMSELFKNDKDE
jgi:hypothetical protein